MLCLLLLLLCRLLLLLLLCDDRQVQRGIDGCCKQLLATLSDHRAACQAFDAAVVWQAPGSGTGSPVKQQQQQHRRTASTESSGSVGGRGSRSSWSGGPAGVAAGAAAAVLRPRFRTAPTQDPWCTEGKLVAEQQALKRWQVRTWWQQRWWAAGMAAAAAARVLACMGLTSPALLA